MKLLLLSSAFLLVFSTGCKKSDQPLVVEATIEQVIGKEVFVRVHNTDSKKYSFLCEADPVITPNPMGIPCASGIFILNLPDVLIVEGKQIRFSRFEDKGPRPIWSYAFAAHDVLVYDAEEL